MKATSKRFVWVFVGTALAALVACSGQGTPFGLTQAGPADLPLLATLHRLPTYPHSDRSKTWMAPRAKTQNLLYISDDGTNDVYVYSWPKGKLLGTLTGFSYPQGECVDKSGDVWIANLGTKQMLEYAHGGTKPIAALNQVGNYISGCAVDPTTGNLAVTDTLQNRGGSEGGEGYLAVYKKARGKPTIYKDPYFDFYFCGYDNHGNLYADGEREYRAGFLFGELTTGSSTFTNVALNQSIVYPGGVQWDGKYVAVGDTVENVIYQFTISGSSGMEVGSTPLDGGSYVLQFWTQGGIAVGPNAGTGNVMFWNYPAGGEAIKTLADFADPVGTVVSLHK